MIIDTEYMGLFSYRDKVISWLKRYLKGLDDYKLINDTNVKNVISQYHYLITQGYSKIKPVKFAGSLPIDYDKNTDNMAENIRQNTGLPITFILYVFGSLYDLSKTGKIDYSIYDPKGYEEQRKAISKNLPSQQTVIEKIESTSKNIALKGLLPIAIIAAAAAGFYLFKK